MRVGGNIGVPLSEQVDESTPETLHVVEASSFQLEATDTFHPWIAALLNVSPDHLDQHPSVEAYAAAKARIFRRQTANDWAVVNEDDEPARRLAAGAKAARIAYGLSLSGEGFTLEGDAIVERRAGVTTRLVPVALVRVPGRHILSDVVAASAISRTAGTSAEAMAMAVAGFAGLEHAMELAGAVGGVRFVNDSKATNVESARRSIESVAAGLVVIMGGRYKGGNFADLAAPLRERGGKVVAIGEAAPLIEEALAGRVDGMCRRPDTRPRPRSNVWFSSRSPPFDGIGGRLAVTSAKPAIAAPAVNGLRVSRSMSRRNARSSGAHSAIATPLLPARAVRPMRCT